MPFPYLFRKLFQNDGAGEKLNPGVIPTTVNGVAADASGNIAIKDTNIPNGPFFPLTGGTVTGDVKVRQVLGNSSLALHALTTADAVELAAVVATYSDKKSAGLILAGVDHGKNDPAHQSIPAGTFYLSATDGTNLLTLDGHPDGGLYWASHPVATVVASYYGDNAWYRKYSDGWIEQGGSTHMNFWTDWNVTFPIPYTKKLCAATAEFFVYGAGAFPRVLNLSLTGMLVARDYYTTNGIREGNAAWYSCGI